MACCSFFFFFQAGTNGIEVVEQACPRIFRNTVRASAKCAVLVEAGANATVLENFFENCGSSAVVVSGPSTEASVIMNRICKCAAPAISVENGARGAVFTNQVQKEVEPRAKNEQKHSHGEGDRAQSEHHHGADGSMIDGHAY